MPSRRKTAHKASPSPAPARDRRQGIHPGLLQDLLAPLCADRTTFEVQDDDQPGPARQSPHAPERRQAPDPAPRSSWPAGTALQRAGAGPKPALPSELEPPNERRARATLLETPHRRPSMTSRPPRAAECAARGPPARRHLTAAARHRRHLQPRRAGFRGRRPGVPAPEPREALRSGPGAVPALPLGAERRRHRGREGGDGGRGPAKGPRCGEVFFPRAAPRDDTGVGG